MGPVGGLGAAPTPAPNRFTMTRHTTRGEGCASVRSPPHRAPLTVIELSDPSYGVAVLGLLTNVVWGRRSLGSLFVTFDVEGG